MIQLDKKKEIKCVIWDLDNTLWKGTLLEGDILELKPGIKKILCELDRRGILNSISSKNTEVDSMNKLKEFGLEELFLYPEISWNAKSSSISNIQKNLNISVDTMMFIDDQPFERDEVYSIHPQIECIDAEEYLNLLDHPRLNPKFITTDSEKRRQMYVEDLRRKKIEDNYIGTSEEFLAQLKMQFVISEAEEEDLKRAEELTIRTNQLNATGITYDYDELNNFRISDSHKLYVCELKDKYGSYGKIGVALVEIKDEHWHLKLLLMSCRVMSRGVGSVLLSYIMKSAKSANKKLLADFKKTEKNRQMYIAFKFSNFRELVKNGDGFITFENDLTSIQDYPSYIQVLTNKGHD